MDCVQELARQLGFTRVGEIEGSALIAREEVRAMCAADRCSRYGSSWSCPPACGSLEHCQKRMSSYDGGILVQTTGMLEDDFDLEGLALLQEKHKRAFDTLARQVRRLHPDCLPLTAGTCTLCIKCTYPDKPCRFPTKRLSSMEAYGLLVSDVCIRSGMEYYYGPKTMTYTGCILYRPDKEE